MCKKLLKVIVWRTDFEDNFERFLQNVAVARLSVTFWWCTICHKYWMFELVAHSRFSAAGRVLWFGTKNVFREPRPPQSASHCRNNNKFKGLQFCPIVLWEGHLKSSQKISPRGFSQPAVFFQIKKNTRLRQFFCFGMASEATLEKEGLAQWASPPKPWPECHAVQKACNH